MNDGVPTDEQVARMTDGVRRRIARRRAVGRRIVGASVATVVVVGGVALAAPLIRGSTASTASAGGSARSAASATVAEVLCHADGRTRTASLAKDEDPVAACTAAVRGSAFHPEASAGTGGSASRSPSPAVCIDDDGRRNVYLDGTACTAHGMGAAP